MKKLHWCIILIFLLIVFLFFVQQSLFINNTTLTHITELYSYPKSGFYYYYSKNFNLNTFKIPSNVKPIDNGYHIFIYDTLKPETNFKYWSDNTQKIADNPDELFSHLGVGIDNKPFYYIWIYNDEIIACELKSDNTQIQYKFDKRKKKFKKTKIFNTGSLNIGSICNSKYHKGDDI